MSDWEQLPDSYIYNPIIKTMSNIQIKNYENSIIKKYQGWINPY